MYKKILCPIDGSATSNAGMNEAILLAKDQNAELRFLYVIDTFFP
ncbi:MAG: universal stress protein, partial [Methylotenera sp.]|nr:universal stress protein [Methylotenera sp.]